MPPTPSQPVYASFPSEKLTIGAGVAIFHLASARVVVCYHTRDKYWFLPKGRRNANEDTVRAAEREGFEESGYRNRALPLPLKHRQPDPDDGPHEVFVTDPVWTQFLPLSATSQYLLFWYVSETVPKDVEESCNESTSTSGPATAYKAPPPFPRSGTTIKQRVALDTVINDDGKQTVYEPRRHEGTGVDEEEMLYRSYLLPVEEARRRLKGSVMEDVVRRGWDAIQLRMKMEGQA
jgi:8-oxo-dGTP pyrophosphatase MutT (NUDIX family)